MTEVRNVPVGWDAHVHVFAADAAVRAGHYQPAARLLAEIEAVGLAHGIGHLVLVQPSVYGTDNRILLNALQEQPGRHRGVVVVDPFIGLGQFDEMHEAGVRGIRFNLVSPVGEKSDVATTLECLAPALHRLGWHVQWYVDTTALPQLVELQRRTGLSFVLDHLAGMHPGVHNDAQAWEALEQLALAGSWLKLSGWYRLQAEDPYIELDPIIDRIAKLFASHLVWGSDWPHTSFSAGKAPQYESTWAPVVRVLGQGRADQVCQAARLLYA